MKLHAALLPIVLLGMLADGAPAQQQASAVQLPTFSAFSTATTVSVPDRGSAFLGGINRAAAGRNELGTGLLPLRNTNFAVQRGASQMHVTVTVHDFQAMDEYLLGRPVVGRSSSVRPAFRPSMAISRPTLPPSEPGAGSSWELSGPSLETSLTSVAQVRARRLKQQQTRGAEAARFFARGERAEAEGKANVARIYYEMAARLATDRLKEEVSAKLEAAGNPKKRVSARLEAASRSQTDSSVVRSIP